MVRIGFTIFVISERYFTLLNKFIPKLRKHSVDMHNVWIMHDLTTQHTAIKVLDALYEQFGHKVS